MASFEGSSTAQIPHKVSLSPVVTRSIRFASSIKENALPQKVWDFVAQAAQLCNPSAIHVCSGTEEETKELLALLEKAGTVKPLNPLKRPNSYAAFTDPSDVARAEKDTFICSTKKSDAGPTNNWMAPAEMKAHLNSLFSGCMEGRTMYVIPFSMGPLGSRFAKTGVQVTDSAYVAVSMHIMTRMGAHVLPYLNDEFVPCMHSVGRPLRASDDSTTEAYRSAHSAWPCNIANRRIVQFPDSREIWSFGSGYGGNSLLGKKCFALRIASVQARDEGWLAEHMLILGITNPAGKKSYIMAAFPSACGKTNLAMMQSSLPGWKVETVGDDIAWIRPGADGRLYAVNPEFGFFGVAPGTNMKSNPNAMASCSKKTLFTNVGLTASGDIYWEDMGDIPNEPIMDWRQKQNWKPTLKADGKVDKKTNPCAHPNSRFTSPITQCPVLDPNWNNPEGVPIDAIIFGGRRSDTLPLVFESFGWQHGTFLGSAMRSQATSAADQVGLVNDPMAMSPFIGYNVKDYFQHWLEMGAGSHGCAGGVSAPRMPKIFYVNWFQQSETGAFRWPGFGENIRVLDWILARVAGTAAARQTAIGYLPTKESLNLKDIQDFDPKELDVLTSVDKPRWREEVKAIRAYYAGLMKNDATPVPEALVQELDALEKRLA